MNSREFFKKWSGKYLDTDKYPPGQPFQCVDVINQYNKDVIGGPAWKGDAVDRFTKFPKDFYIQVPYVQGSSFTPLHGSIVVFGKSLGPSGHIGVIDTAVSTSFISFDQNFPLKSKCGFVLHDYKDVIGFLIPKKLITMQLLEIHKIPTKEDVFGLFKFSSEEEIKVYGKSFKDLHYPGVPKLYKSPTNDQVYMLIPIDSFDLSNPYISSDVEIVTNIML